VKHRRVSLLSVFLLIATSSFAAAATVPDRERVEQIAKMLPASPRGVGPTIADRAAWKRVAETPEFRDVVRDAQRLMKTPIPKLTDDLFLDYSRTGNRSRCQRILSQRQGRYPLLVLAECIENRGRFLPAIEESIRACCTDKTWVLPAHDRSLRNFRGETTEIDLRVANEAWNLATVDYWLGDKLSPAVRKLIDDELERRVFTSFESTLKTGTPRSWWIKGTNNWNAVCLAGVVGSAVTKIESPQRRAVFIAAAEHYVENFRRGFTADGYCSEGVGYWNYGFGHYVLLSEAIHQATGGKLDLLAGERIERMARFAPRMEIVSGIYPAFADCSPASQPDTALVAFLSRRYGMGLLDVEKAGLGLKIGPTNRLFELGLCGFENSASTIAPVDGKPMTDSPREWFPDGGAYIGRMPPGGKRPFGVAVKGGNNAEHHNHNDVGTYLVALGKAVPLVDPGAEVYTSRTFSGKRYVSGVLNSFGHPVPRVAGKLQRTGRSAHGEILKTEFTDAADTLAFDIRSAYDVKELKTLVRTFVFSREGQGSLTVTDEVEFAAPQTFETALVTFSNWKQLEPGRLRFGDGDEAVDVTITTDAGKFKIDSVTIDEDVRHHSKPVRVGITLAEPVTKATVTVKITPVEK